MRISDWSSDVCSSDLVYRADEDRHLTALHVRIAQCCHCGGVRRIKLDGDFRRFLTDLFGQGGNGGQRAERGILALVEIAVDRQFGCTIQPRSDEHTSELQSLMRISYAVCCLKNK